MFPPTFVVDKKQFQIIFSNNFVASLSNTEANLTKVLLKKKECMRNELLSFRFQFPPAYLAILY